MILKIQSPGTSGEELIKVLDLMHAFLILTLFAASTVDAATLLLLVAGKGCADVQMSILMPKCMCTVTELSRVLHEDLSAT